MSEVPSLGGGARRPDVALFLPMLAVGGAERVALNLAAEFGRMGLVVDLVLVRAEGPLMTAVPPGARVVDLGRSRMAAAAPALLAYAWRWRPKVLLSTLEHANVMALALAPLLPGVRVAIREANTATEDTDRSSWRGRWVLAAMRALYPTARRVIAVSDGVAEVLHTNLGVRRDRIHVIPNPVVTPEMLDAAREKPGHPWFGDGGPPIVLAAGRLVRQKGFATLLEAFALARQRTPCRLIILGEGPLRGELESAAGRLGVEDAVALPGFAPNPFAAMARAGVFVLSSEWEGLPNVLIQAMAVGAKVVATDCPSGPREILEGGRLGRLVPVGDAPTMAQAIAEVLEGAHADVSDAWTERYRSANVARTYAEALGLEVTA